MAIKCPKCSSEKTQSVRAILQSGTTYSTGSMTGMGLGTDGAGVFSGSSSSTSQTHLAARFAPPKKPKKLEIIAGGILSLASSPWLFSGTPLMAISIGLIALWAWELRSYSKKNKKYQQEYPIWQSLHSNGFYCHTCANAFMVN